MSSTTKKRILLIQCGPDAGSYDLQRSAFDLEKGSIRYDSPVVPIACATIAGLTPDTYHVDIWDENLRGQIRRDTQLEAYDIVGVSLMFAHLGPHARALGRFFRRRGILTVAGGPGISAAPENFRDSFDVLFINEAERTWPAFLRDYETGDIQKEYRQIDKPDMSESPMPRWANAAADVPRYEMGSVQTTRGCPFDCEFCDVIYLYGRKQRHKPVGRVLDEVRALEALGSKSVFFTDDEFVGDATYTKELLSELIPVNGAFRRPLWFFTQLTLNLSRDEELLELMADANFYSALVGVESFDKGALRETGKHHNAARDILRDLKKIQSYGLGILGTFIVGFDHDDVGVFDRLYQGIQEACLPWVLVTPLYAVHNTKLWARLQAEGRVATVRLRRKDEVFGLNVNIVPRGMSRVELIEGYRHIIERLHSWESILARLRGWIGGVRRAPRVREEPFTEAHRDKLLRAIRESWEVSPSELAGIGDTVAYAADVAPYLLPRLTYFLYQNELIKRQQPRVFQGYESMLDAERRGDLVQDPRPLLVPRSFGAAMTLLFPDLFLRLFRSLPNERMIAGALTEVFVDFVVRWGATFQKIEPEHKIFLLELCDRAAAKRGGVLTMDRREGEDESLREARKARLLDAVLKDARDELATGTAVRVA